MPSSCSCFAKIVKCLRKGTIAPRQGHLCARVRAQLCPRKAQGCTSQTPPVNPKHRFLSIRDTSCKQVICTQGISNIDFCKMVVINFLLCPGIFFSLPTQEFFRGQGKIKVGTETKKHSHFLTSSREEMGAQNIMVCNDKKITWYKSAQHFCTKLFFYCYSVMVQRQAFFIKNSR